MKRIKLWIGIVLALVLVLGFGSPVSAQDPPEAEEVNVAVVGDAEVSVSVVGDAQVDMALVGGGAEIGMEIEGDAAQVGVDIEGDQTQVGVDITGEDSTVTINGVTPFVTYSTSTYHVSRDKWAKEQVKEVILPWMEETENTIALTADGLADALLLAQRNESGLRANDFLIESYSDRLANLKSEVNSLDAESEDLAMKINALEVEKEVMRDYLEYQTAYYNYQTAYFNQMAFYNRALMVIGALGVMAFGFWMRARAKRQN